MTREEASVVLSRLVAAFPQVVLERESVELYVARIGKLEQADLALEAANLIISHEDKFPTLAMFLDAYEHVRCERGASAATSHCGCAEGWIFWTHIADGREYETAEPCPRCGLGAALLARATWGAREAGRIVCAHQGCTGRRTCVYAATAAPRDSMPELLATALAVPTEEPVLA